MLRSDETKSGKKSNQRKAKPAQANKKGEQRNHKAALSEDPKPAPQDPKPDQSQDIIAEETGAPVALVETPEPLPAPADTPPTVPTGSEENAAVSYRTIADAWGNYSRMSLEQTRAYFERLAGVRSLGGAFEVQAEFARQACETFVAESQRIRELHGEMTKQRLRRLEGFMEKMTQSTLGGRQN